MYFFENIGMFCCIMMYFFENTRSYAALRAADLEWIVGPGYSLGGYILEKNHEKTTWNHENHEKPWKPWKTMKNHEKPWKTNLEPWETMKNHEKSWKTM